MQPFLFSTAKNADEAVKEAYANKTAKFIGGGTNLVDLMKMNVEAPGTIIDINALPFDKIESLPDGGMRIGALVRNSDLAYNETIQKNYPVLSQALLAGASPQLRNMATVGGNLMQRTRCPYFYGEGFRCNKKNPGAGCDALHGYNRSHAVLGTSDHCIATHPSDMCVALLALGATILVLGINGEKKIPIETFHLLPGDTPQIETALEHGELITAIILPPASPDMKSGYLKIRDRASFDFALVSVAVVLDYEGNKIKHSSIALGGVGTKPWKCHDAEMILNGKPASKKIFQQAAEASMRGAKAYPYNGFKIEMAKRAVTRALLQTGGLS